jgi:hypothetical protein
MLLTLNPAIGYNCEEVKLILHLKNPSFKIYFNNIPQSSSRSTASRFFRNSCFFSKIYLPNTSSPLGSSDFRWSLEINLALSQMKILYKRGAKL